MACCCGGTNHRLQPIVPYLEAFWYTLVNNLQYHNSTFSTSLMSYVGGVYPPITAALLVFVIFVLLYHEYDEKIGLIGAALTAMMPVLFTTFIAGEQLVEPWGIFALFFFFATYMLAIRNKKDKRLAVLAGIAFASNFLGRPLLHSHSRSSCYVHTCRGNNRDTKETVAQGLLQDEHNSACGDNTSSTRFMRHTRQPCRATSQAYLAYR